MLDIFQKCQTCGCLVLLYEGLDGTKYDEFHISVSGGHVCMLCYNTHPIPMIYIRKRKEDEQAPKGNQLYRVSEGYLLPTATAKEIFGEQAQ